MTKRSVLVRELRRAGFVPNGGRGHEKFVHPDGRYTLVPRRAEIPNQLVRVIRKQAGIV